MRFGSPKELVTMGRGANAGTILAMALAGLQRGFMEPYTPPAPPKQKVTKRLIPARPKKGQRNARCLRP